MNNENNCLQNKTNKMDHFLEICLLIILSIQSGYGYDLMTQLTEFGFSPSKLNIGSLYRILRKMEGRNLVFSQWESSTLGPKKRIYQITEVGCNELADWMRILKERQIKITFVIDKYQGIKGDKKR